MFMIAPVRLGSFAPAHAARLHLARTSPIPPVTFIGHESPRRATEGAILANLPPSYSPGHARRT